MSETETKEKPSWVNIKPAELEKIVIELGKQGETPSKIGLILRDKHGIPKAKLLGKKITKILKDAKIDTFQEKANVEKKVEKIKKHLLRNKHDNTAKKSLAKKLWIVNKFNK